MALTPPTVPASPTTTDINTALDGVNTFVNNANAAVISALSVIREVARLGGGNIMDLQDIDDATLALNTGVPSPTVSDTNASTSNTALTTLTNAIIDVASTETGAPGAVLNRILKKWGAQQAHTDFAAAATTLAADDQTPPTVSTTPVTDTELNAALVTATGFVDTLNAHAFAVLNPFGDVIKRRGATLTHLSSFNGAMLALQP